MSDGWLTSECYAGGAAVQPTDDLPSSPPQRQASAMVEPAAKAATGKRKASAAPSGGGKKGSSGSAGAKKAKQQQQDASQRSIMAFFARSPSGQAGAAASTPVPAQHRIPSAQIAAAGSTHAAVKQESPTVQLPVVDSAPDAEAVQVRLGSLRAHISIGCGCVPAALGIVLHVWSSAFSNPHAGRRGRSEERRWPC